MINYNFIFKAAGTKDNLYVIERELRHDLRLYFFVESGSAFARVDFTKREISISFKSHILADDKYHDHLNNTLRGKVESVTVKVNNVTRAHYPIKSVPEMIVNINEARNKLKIEMDLRLCVAQQKMEIENLKSKLKQMSRDE